MMLEILPEKRLVREIQAIRNLLYVHRRILQQILRLKYHIIINPVGSRLPARPLDKSSEILRREMHLVSIEPHRAFLTEMLTEKHHKFLEIAYVFVEHLLVTLIVGRLLVNHTPYLEKYCRYQAAENVVRGIVRLIVVYFFSYRLYQVIKLRKALFRKLHHLRRPQLQQLLCHRLYVKVHLMDKREIHHRYMHRHRLLATLRDIHMYHLTRKIDEQIVTLQMYVVGIGRDYKLARLAKHEHECVKAERMRQLVYLFRFRSAPGSPRYYHAARYESVAFLFLEY